MASLDKQSVLHYIAMSYISCIYATSLPIS